MTEAKATAQAPGETPAAPLSMAGAGPCAGLCSCALTSARTSSSSSSETFEVKLETAIANERRELFADGCRQRKRGRRSRRRAVGDGFLEKEGFMDVT
ncbi:hypothetical protein BHE74_00056052 [Ensete ventricosum]|nr:hypothetical protein BHE74_00056052 [Ensete ventricosum]